MNTTTYFENERIRLRAIEPEDLNEMYGMENNPAVWEVSSFTVPYSKYILKEFIENSHNDIYTDKQLRLMICRKADGQILGMIDISDFSPLHQRGAVGIVVHEAYRQQGYGKDALQLLCEYASRFLHLGQLYAHVPADNTPSLRMFAACGFTERGVMRNWLRTAGGYKDVVMMQKLFDAEQD